MNKVKELAIKKMCPRCRRVIDHAERYCKECMARLNKDYDKYVRDKESKDFYNSRSWLKVRKIVLDKYHGLDLYQLKINKRIVYADTVHHIEELKDDSSKALDINNLIPVSAATHNYIHSEYKKDKKKIQSLLRSLV